MSISLISVDADTIENYRLILQGVTYFHDKPDMLNTRKFILSCSSQNGRFISNELDIKVNFLLDVFAANFFYSRYEYEGK